MLSNNIIIDSSRKDEQANNTYNTSYYTCGNELNTSMLPDWSARPRRNRSSTASALGSLSTGSEGPAPSRAEVLTGVSPLRICVGDASGGSVDATRPTLCPTRAI